MTTTRIFTKSIFDDQRLLRNRILWVMAVICGLVTTYYFLIVLNEYQNSGTVPVDAAWNRTYNAIELHPTDPQLTSVIRPGDLLLAQNGQPIPQPLVFHRFDFPPIYGGYGETVTVTIQTPGEAPRDLQLTLNQRPDINTNWLLERGFPLETIHLFWFVTTILWLVLFWAVALYVVYRRPRDPMAVLTSAALIVFSVRTTNLEYLRFFPVYQYPLQLVNTASSLMLLLMLILPDGRWYPRRVSMAIWWAAAFLHLNRFARLIPALSTVFIFTDMLLMASVIAVQIYRYRTYYTDLQRQQVRWVVAGVCSAVVGYYLGISYIMVVGRFDFISLNVMAVVVRIGVVTAITALAIAILRYRLYDADYALNRSMVYSGVAVLLATGFFVLIALLRLVFPENEVSTTVLLVVAVAMGMLFQPTSRRIQHFIDRRFFRLRLDLNELAEHRKTHPEAHDRTFVDDHIGDITLEGLIGRGGMSEVFRGKRGTQRLAVKILLPDDENSPEYVARFRREMTIMEQLNHPNIVHMIDCGATPEVAFIAMEFVDGQPLNEYLKQRKRLPLDQVKLILKDITQALDYAHDLGIVHRDVKPANVMLQDTRAVLMDFGIARFIGSGTSITKEGFLGTLDYIAPEQLKASQVIDHRADIYSLGIMTYQMLSGDLPFRGGVGHMVFAHLQQPPPNIIRICPELSPRIGEALVRAMAKDPAQRYASAKDFLAALG